VKNVAILATASATGEVGGAERFYQGLRNALEACGVNASIVSVVSDESNFRSIMQSYLKFYDLDLSRYDGVISTKAPGYVIRHPNHVCYLQHTMRVFYDMFGVEFPRASDELLAQRRRIQALDTAALSGPYIKKLFVIGEEVRSRLLQYNGLDAEVLYQATTIEGFRQGKFEYLFMPGRLHRWKRVDLVIRAMKLVKSPVRLLISGTGEDEQALKEMAAGDSRITFLGRISEQDLIDYYSNALAVMFVPQREDFGLVAVEAFHSAKPVITCSDSGEPSKLVEKFGAGVVCKPSPESIAAAIDDLYSHPEKAKEWGASAAAGVRQLSWNTTALRLIEALGFSA
jgi:glycosyltransferase involved in cell wall biosynthesis